MARLPIKEGQPFSTEEYNKAKELLFQTANNQGYIKADLVKKEILINLQSNTAIITWHFDTGQRYYFGETQFNHTAYSPEFLNRFKTLEKGDAFSSEILLKYQQDLSNSHYFQQVIVTPQLNEIEGTKVPVHVWVSLPKAEQYRIGLGYGTFTDPAPPSALIYGASPQLVSTFLRKLNYLLY